MWEKHTNTSGKCLLTVLGFCLHQQIMDGTSMKSSNNYMKISEMSSFSVPLRGRLGCRREGGRSDSASESGSYICKCTPVFATAMNIYSSS